MRTLKTSTILLLSIILFSFNKHQNYNKNPIKNSSKDSIWVYKSEMVKVIKFDSNKNQDSVITKVINYHIVNFSTSEITLIFKPKEKDWESKSFEYYSTKESSENIEFNTNSSICQKVYLDVNPLNSIVYSFNDNNLYIFNNIKKIKIDEVEKLGIYKWRDSYEPIVKTKEVVINEHIKDFEYSEHWKTESYKKVVEFMKQKINKDNPKCKIVSRSYYNSNLVQYIGNQCYKVKIYCEFDCNQNYINQSYFWVEAYYLGYGKWDLELIDQKLTH